MFLLAGFVLLVVGGDVLVRSASSLALRLGVGPLVIGLTVVAFGTSAPELAATLASALQGAPDLGVGNVLGSNIANVGLILGGAAILVPLASNSAFLRRDMPLAILVMLLLVPLTLDGNLGRLDGLLLLGVLAVYLLMLFRRDPDAIAPSDAEPEQKASPWWRAIGGVLVGLGLLVLGADLVVRGGVGIATQLGVSERIIGLTIVAFGTSLPEVASSLAAAARRQGDMILGNIAGSNLFNVLVVLGATAGAATVPVQLSQIGLDLAVAAAFSLAVIPIMLFSNRLGRLAGVVLLAGYLVYVTTLFLPA